MSSVVFDSVRGSVRGGYRDRYDKYYPGTFIDDYGYSSQRGDRRAYRTYAGHRRDGFDYVTTTEPFKPDPDYYIK